MRFLLALLFLTTATAGGFHAYGAEIGGKVANDFPVYAELLLEQHPSLQSLNATLSAKKNVPDRVASLPDPQLKLGVMNAPYDPLSFKEEGMTQKQVGISQMFPAPGKLGMKKKIAETDVEIVSLMIPVKQMDLLESARINFYKVRFLKKSKSIIKNNIDILEGFIKVALTKYTVGNGLQQNVLHAQVELTKMSDRLRRVQQAIASTEKQLAIWANLPVDSIWESLAVEPLQKIEGETDMLLEKAVENRPLFKALRTKISKAGKSMELAKLGLRPDYVVGFTYGQRDDGPAGNRNDLMSASVSLNIPIYYKTKQNKEIAEKMEFQRKAHYDLTTARWELRYRIADLLEKEKKNSELSILYDASLLPQAKQTVDASFAAYQVNKVDFLTLVLNQIAVFNYEIERDRIEFDQQADRTRLLRALGKNNLEMHNEGQ